MKLKPILIILTFFIIINISYADTIFDDFDKLDISSINQQDPTDSTIYYNSEYQYKTIYDWVAGSSSWSDITNQTNGIKHFSGNSGTGDSYRVDWLIINLTEVNYAGNQVYFTFNYSIDTLGYHRNVGINYKNATGQNVWASQPYLRLVTSNNVTTFTLTELTGETLENISELVDLRLYVSHGTGSIHFAGEGNLEIHWFNITTDSIENQLPEVNFTIPQYTYCFNESLGYTTIPLNISAYDRESDSIYYAIDFDSVNTTDSITFTKEVFLFGDKPDFSFTNNLYYPTDNVCLFNTEEDTNFSKFNLYAFNNWYGDNRYMIEATYLCDKSDKSIYYRTNYNFQIFRYKSFVYAFNNGENISIKFKTFGLEDMYNFNFRYLNDRFLIYTLNSTTEIELLNISATSLKDSNDFGIEFQNYRTVDDNTSLVIHLNETTSILLSVEKITNVDDKLLYIGYTIDDNSAVYFDEFSYTGVYIRPDFSLNTPTKINVSGEGYTQVTLFVTDTPHLSTDYDIKVVGINILPSELCYSPLLEQSDNIEDNYANINNLSGVPLILNQFVWFLRFPYRLGLHFGILNELIGGAFLLIILLSFSAISTGKITNIEHLVYLVFGVSTLLMVMKLFYVAFYLIILAIFSGILVSKIFPQLSEGG